MSSPTTAMPDLENANPVIHATSSKDVSFRRVGSTKPLTFADLWTEEGADHVVEADYSSAAASEPEEGNSEGDEEEIDQQEVYGSSSLPGLSLRFLKRVAAD